MYWRPLAVLAIALPQVMGLPIVANKALSLLLFAGAGWMLLTCHARTASSPIKFTAPLLAALLALSPVFAETIVLLSARFDLLLLFFLSALLLRHTTLVRQTAGHEAPYRYAIEGVAWALALGLSKESGCAWAAGAAAIVMLDGMRCSRDARLVRMGIGLALGVLLVLALRYVALAVSTHEAARVVISQQSFIPAFCEALARQLVLLILPFLDRAPTHYQGWGIPAVIYVLCVVLPVLVMSGIFLSFRAWHAGSASFRMLAWAVLAGAALIAHAALCAWSDMVGGLVPERYMAPSVAVLLPLAMTALSGLAGRARVAGMGLALLAAISAMPYSMDDKIAWSSNMDLWSRTWEYGPHYKSAAINYTTAALVAGQPKLSLQAAKEWMAEHPEEGLENCHFAEIIAHLESNPQALRAMLESYFPYAWCSPSVVLKAVAVLGTDRAWCPSVLQLARRASETSRLPSDERPWKYRVPVASGIAEEARVKAEGLCGAGGG
jgi:hypothetical protein